MKSVKDFGAKGDGVTDDRDAFAAACEANEPGIFPPGTYRLAVDMAAPNAHDVAVGVVASRCIHDSRPRIDVLARGLLELEESDADRGEIIKRAMMALDHAGVPNEIERQPTDFSLDDDPLEVLARRIRWLAVRARKG